MLGGLFYFNSTGIYQFRIYFETIKRTIPISSSWVEFKLQKQILRFEIKYDTKKDLFN